MNNFFLIPLVVLSCILAYTIITPIDFFDIKGNPKENFYPYIWMGLSFIFSLLILLLLRKKYDIYYFLNLLWLAPVFIMIFKFLLGTYNTQKLDYLMSKKINNYELAQFEDNKGWNISRITIRDLDKTDTLYISENPTWENITYRLKNKNETTIVKSVLTGYYYVTLRK